MDFIIGIGAKIAEYTVAPVGRQLGYLFRYTTNVSELRTQLEDLNNATQRMERRVNEALNNCHEIEADVQTWQKNAEKISGEATTFLNPQTHAKALCSCGSPHHLVTRHRLSRKANKMSVNVRAVVLKNKEFDSMPISYPRPPEGSSATPAKGYESFDSRGEILKSILAAVGDGNRKRIGLHGMGGIGKTMLAKEITRLAQEDKLFSKVVVTTVSQTPNIKEIQQHIAEKLGLKLEEKDSTGKRAELLRMRLKQDESKILLILDDIWNELDLEAIGIHEECRMLITSRDQQVLRNFMGVAESNVFLIGALESSEAINLFIKIIGDTKTDYINALALEIVNECGGLPIAIATVAHALKYKKEEAIWKDALRRLKSSDVNDKVYSSIKLSYDFLGSHEEEAKSLLLLCALHKEDEEIQVEDLMRYSMGWRLLQGIYAVSEARNRVNSLVDTLKSHCLLLDGTSTSDEVKMHDVIRDVCIKIAKEDHGHGHMMMNNITSAAMYEEFVFHERHKASKAISFLDYGDFDNLPQKLDCPMLELLLLSSGSYLESIPNDFFEQTRQLKVLCMNRTWIGSLPSSFASLRNLQTLRLRDSSLEDIAVIGELKNLKALDLSYCHSIERLSKEIGALTLLQVLDLRECYKLRVIEANVISNLTQIEELYLPHEFEGWDEIINEEGGVRNGSLIEIKSLQRLTALHLYVPREHALPQGLFSEKLERYNISIGVKNSNMYGVITSSKMLRLQLSQLDQIYGSGSGLDLVMKGSEYLSLDGLNCVNNVFHDLHKDGFPRLKELSFGNNDGFHYIINSTHHQAFPSLESLRLSGLRSLESIICHGGNNKLPIGSFNQLREVYVRCCGRLKNLFPLSVAKLLHQITVQECEMIEEIIVREDGDEVGHNIDGDDDHSSSLQLRSLHLEYLPKLVQFYCSNHRAVGESDHSKPLFSETVCFPNLEDLTMKKMDIEMLWPEQLMLSSTSSFYMQNLTSLKVGSCHNLKYLFSSSVAQKFVNLKKIKVEDCEGMEDIIRVVDQPGEEESTHHHHDQIERIDLLPKLQSVKLVGLSSLQTFCTATNSSLCMVFPLLSKLLIKDCSTMKAQATLSTQEPFFNKKVSFPKLEDLTMRRTNIEKLWPDQLMLSSSSSSSSYMQNLTTLELEMCHNLKYLFSSSVAQKFVNLMGIQVASCKGMEDIIRVVDQPGEEETTHHDQMERIDLFPKLVYLELDGLSSLQRFCSATDSSSCMVFPLLSKLIIEKCPEMKAFVSCPTQPFYSEKVCFPNLEDLTMKKMEIEILWPEQLMLSSTSSFHMQNLTTLEVEECNNLKYLFSSSVAQKFVNLKSIKVEDCEAMEDIIRVVDQPGEEETTHHDHDHMEMINLFPKLESVKLDRLSSLQTFCSAEKISFPNLKKLAVWQCNNLKSLLSSAMPRSLVQLEKLSISECEKMEEVIVMSDHDKEYSSSSSGGTNTKAIIPFQNLRYLKLYSLPNFIRFCELGDYCIECPLLSELEIMKCPKLKELFMGDKRTSSSCTINTTDNNIIGEEMDRMVSAPNKQILFKHNNKVIFPMLKVLRSDWSEGMKEIFEMSSNSIVLFPNLDRLDLTCECDEPIGVPDLKLFLYKYHTIRTLTLWGSFVNMSSDDELTTNNTTNATTTHLTSTPSTSSLEKLWIAHADMLDHVFGVEPSSHSNTTILLLFPNLKEIKVTGCTRLQNFAPSFMCFPNLETLKVSTCHGLRYLLSSSTATTLVQLQRMVIAECDEMKEIIINHNGNEEQEKEENPRIVFQNLKQLELKYLPNLQSFFYSGNKVTMSIPNLEQLWINSCRMRRFSDGIVDTSASLLKTIEVDWKRIDVERDDVNATLAKLFREDNNKNNNSDWDYDNNNLAHQKDNNDEHRQGQG